MRSARRRRKGEIVCSGRGRQFETSGGTCSGLEKLKTKRGGTKGQLSNKRMSLF